MTRGGWLGLTSGWAFVPALVVAGAGVASAWAGDSLGLAAVLGSAAVLVAWGLTLALVRAVRVVGDRGGRPVGSVAREWADDHRAARASSSRGRSW